MAPSPVRLGLVGRGDGSSDGDGDGDGRDGDGRESDGRESDANDAAGEEGGFNPLRPLQYVIDPIVTSPVLPYILLLGPFLQNSGNRRRFAQLRATTDPVLFDSVLILGGGLIAAYFLYEYRVRLAEEASERREGLLQDLGDRRRAQFEAAAASGGVGAASRSTSSGTSTTTPEEELAKAAAEYEGALREELELRSIVPALGWRLDFPDDPATRDEDRAAARRYLGLDITEDGTLVDLGGR